MVSAVRWVHSLVIAITPITGSNSTTPVEAALRKSSKADGPVGMWVSCQVERGQCEGQDAQDQEPAAAGVD